MLLTGEHFRSFWESFGRPIGVGAEAKVELSGASRFPRTPRLVTLLLLAGAAAILLRGEMRTGIAMVSASVTDAQWNPARWHSVHDLQRKAAETGDAKLLGLLSLLAESETERVRLAEQAIAKDASLTWLLYEFRLRGEEPEESVIDRAKRVQKWDPENAAPRLMAAEPLFDRFISSSKFGPPTLGHRNELSEMEKAAAANSEWMTAMDWAFSAKTYDAYGTRRLELLRDVVRKYGINDPDITAHVVAGQMMPNFANLLTYARILLYRDTERGSEGSIANARKVLHLTQQIQLHGRTILEDAIAASLAVDACARLQPLLEKAGRQEEAALVGFERDRWKVELERLKSRNLRAGGGIVSVIWAGVAMHLAAAAIVIFGTASLVGFAFLAWRKDGSWGWFGRFCSAAVDWAPLLLLMACLALFVAYHPYARAYQTYFQVQAPAMDEESMESLVNAAAVPHYLPEGMEAGLYAPGVAYASWMAVTVILAMVAGILVLRGWRRRAA